MSLDFETKFVYTGDDPVTFIIKVNEVEVWIGLGTTSTTVMENGQSRTHYSTHGGEIVAVSSLNLDYSLEHGCYFDNNVFSLLGNAFGTWEVTNPTINAHRPKATYWANETYNPLLDTNHGGDLAAHNASLTHNSSDGVHHYTVTPLISACATKWHDTVYVLYKLSGKSEYIRGYDIHTKVASEPFNIPAPAGSDIVAADGRIWYTGSTITGSMQNILHCYTIATGMWSSYTIPLRHQTAKRVLIDGLDGKLWITQYNNHSIVPFNLASNTFGTVRRINRHPRNFAVNQNKQLFVLSEDVTMLFNQSNDTSTQFCANLGHTTMIDDLRTGYMWLVGGEQPTYRMVKSTTGVIEVGAQGVQTDDIYDQVAVLTNQVTYDKYDPLIDTTSSITIRPHLFIKTGTGIVAYRATALKGVNSSQVLGTGMIAIGPQEYIGT